MYIIYLFFRLAFALPLQWLIIQGFILNLMMRYPVAMLVITVRPAIRTGLLSEIYMQLNSSPRMTWYSISTQGRIVLISVGQYILYF